MVLNNYAPDILISFGWVIDGMDKEKNNILIALSLSAITVVGTIVNNLIIDDIGRRKLLMYFLPGVIFTLLLLSLGMFFFIYNDEDEVKTLGKVIFSAALFTYLLTFSIGLSATPSVINNEIYPIHLIGTATAIATASNFLASFIVASVFIYSMDTDAGKVYSFDILAVFAIATYIFVYYLIPETGGKTIN